MKDVADYRRWVDLHKYLQRMDFTEEEFLKANAPRQLAVRLRKGEKVSPVKYDDGLQYRHTVNVPYKLLDGPETVKVSAARLVVKNRLKGVKKIVEMYRMVLR